MTDQAPSNPLFEGFKPQSVGAPLKENPMTGETSKPAKKPRKLKAAKPLKEPKPPRQPKAAKLKPVEPPVSNLQTLFAAMKGLEEVDHALFEKLLGASPASRKRVFVAIAKVFP